MVRRRGRGGRGNDRRREPPRQRRPVPAQDHLRRARQVAPELVRRFFGRLGIVHQHVQLADVRGREDVALHLQDTVDAGDGLVYRPAAEVLVAEGPERVEELMKWGTRFDREGGELMRTREGAHSRPRILHANGDATGAEISRSLVTFARTHERVRFAEWTTVTGLTVADGRVIAADLLDREGNPQRVSARAVLVAAGGGGQGDACGVGR